MKTVNQSKSILWLGMAIGVLLDLALIGLSLLNYPSLLRPESIFTVIFCVGLLFIYSCLGIGLPVRANSTAMIGLRQGTTFGLIIGGVFIVDISVEYFVNLGNQASTLSTLGFMALIFLLFAVASATGTQRTGRMYVGILASLWSAMLGSIIAVFFGLAVNFLFLQRLEQILASDYATSHIQNIQTFTFWNTLDSASSHLLEAPVLAIIFGTLGSLIVRGLKRYRSVAGR